MTAPLLSYRQSGGGVVVDLDRLVASRMLVQANSGGGKSRAIRQLLEQTHGRVQHLVLDPEGEFPTLRERFDYILAAKTGGDTIAAPKYAKRLCRTLVELGASAVLDLYDLTLDERREFVRHFLTELMALPRALWRPIIVVIDEMHVFAPEAGQSQAAEAVTALATQGRKRGFCLVGATQRISKLHKDVAAELLNKMIGRTGLDIDVKRAGDELGMGKDERAGLKTLAPGEFYVYGPAIANSVQIVRTGDVVTSHPEAGKIGSAPPPPSAKVKAMLARLADLPKEAEEEARTIADLQQQLRDSQAKLRRAEKAGAVVERVDDRAIAKAQQDAERRLGATINQLRKALEAAVKFIINVSTQNFDAAGVDKAELERAITAAVDKATQMIDQRLESRAKQIDQLRLQAQRVAAQLKSALGDETAVISVDVAKNAPFTVTTPAAPREPRSRTPRVAAASVEGVSPSMQKILDAAAALERLGIQPAKRINVAFFAGYTENGHFNNMVGELRTKGLLDYPIGGMVELTDAGRAAASAETHPITSLEDLHTLWLSKVSPSEGKLLAVLIANYPNALSRADLAEATGYTENGHFNNMVGHLSTLGAAHYPTRGMVAASDVLFPEGLA